MKTILLSLALAVCVSIEALAQGPLTPLSKHTYQKLDSQLAAALEAIDRGQDEAAAAGRLASRQALGPLTAVSIKTSDDAVASAWLASRGTVVANSGPGVIEAYASFDVLRELSSQ